MWKDIAKIMQNTRTYQHTNSDGLVTTKVCPARTARAQLSDGSRVIGLSLRAREVEMLEQVIEDKKAGMDASDTAAYLAEYGDH